MMGIPVFILGSIGIFSSMGQKKPALLDCTLTQSNPSGMTTKTYAGDTPSHNHTLIQGKEIGREEVNQERHIPGSSGCESYLST